MKPFGYFLCCLLLAACVRKSPQIPANKIEEQPSDTEQLLEYNRACYEAELDEIQTYLDSSSYSFESTDEGLYYATLVTGKGENIQNGQVVTLTCAVELLDGTVCSTMAQATPLQIVVGKRNDIRGLDFILPFLQNQSESIVIIPSHAAYGVRGKSPCIPSRTPILCRIKIIAVQ